MSDSALIRFYRGEGQDTAGRSLATLLAWDDEQLEYVHDYIQWLFPLPERSAFNPAAPLLSAQDVAAFLEDARLRQALRAAWERMLRFYGFALSQDGSVAAERDASRPWLTPGNHNFLRITRILRALTLLGLSSQAEVFLAALQILYDSGAAHVIGARSLKFWRGAVHGR
jgi:hypothetical protein